jgi:hypothetical protein
MMLKESATTTEGIFRVSGSNKRINELQTIFDTSPRFGKDLDWSSFTVHDAASVLRRFLNLMPVRHTTRLEKETSHTLPVP